MCFFLLVTRETGFGTGKKKRVFVSTVSTRTTTEVQLKRRKRDVMQPKTFCKTAQADMKTTSLSITKCVQLNTQ